MNDKPTQEGVVPFEQEVGELSAKERMALIAKIMQKLSESSDR